jgi:hypothetical protein
VLVAVTRVVATLVTLAMLDRHAKSASRLDILQIGVGTDLKRIMSLKKSMPELP